MSKKEHHNRPDLIGEHRLGDAGQLISFILFALVWISDGFIFKKTIFLNDIIPLYIRLPLAAITICISAYLVITSMSIIFGEKRDKAEIISKAIYGKMRHPMYVSEVLLYFGLLCLNISIVATGIWLLIVIFLYAICRYEEKLLLAHFGEEYKNYMKKVPMWVPRLRKKK
ncbi:MAG: isoprenylcysteine carboxylmethyltransferase family protein [Candidatus Marinimicrobia bacterium]|nr:isoprenylcysteine carboxylmethyltransferase family protein [Candidatus Neomarinimicrobiota bacterium]